MVWMIAVKNTIIVRWKNGRRLIKYLKGKFLLLVHFEILKGKPSQVHIFITVLFFYCEESRALNVNIEMVNPLEIKYDL